MLLEGIHHGEGVRKLFRFLSAKLVEARGLKVDGVIYMFLGLLFWKMPVE